jgi:hypothetical protein
MNSAICTENAKEHADTFYEFLQLIKGTIAQETPEGIIRDKKRNELIHSFIRKVCDQNKVNYTTSLANRISIPSSCAYLLSKENGFAKLLQLSVDGFSINTQEDVNCLGQLAVLPGKVERSIQRLCIEQEISSEQLLKLIQQFSTLKTLSISIEFSDNQKVFEAIAGAKQLKHLNLMLPELKEVQKEKPTQPKSLDPFAVFGGFGGFGNPELQKIFGPGIQPSVSYTYSQNECLFFSPKIIAFLDTLSTLTVNCKCVITIPKTADRDNVAGNIKKRFSKTIEVEAPSNYENIITIEPLRKKEQPQRQPNIWDGHPFGKFI